MQTAWTPPTVQEVNSNGSKDMGSLKCHGAPGPFLEYT